MRGSDCSTSGCTKRKKRSQSSSSLFKPFGYDSEGSKRSKTTATRESKLMMNSTTGIDDLPDVLLIEILSRVPFSEFSLKCKDVCKRWRNLMSDPHFPPLLTMINQRGQNLPYPPSGPKFLTRLFKRLMSSLSLKSEPFVVGACNDLVLCSATERRQRDYFICNPYTTEWIALPRPSGIYFEVPVGFKCDPCTNINNLEYRCKVVRIIAHDQISGYDSSDKFKVQIYSLEAGEWRESIISFSREFSLLSINSNAHFGHDGMLYWSSKGGRPYNFLIGLDPFTISDTTTSRTNSISTASSTSTTRINKYSGDDKCYECRYIELVLPKDLDLAFKQLNGSRGFQIECLGMPGGGGGGGGGGCLQICALQFSSNKSLVFWELKEEGDLIIDADGVRKLYPRKHVLNLKKFGKEVQLVGFDPNKKGNVYVTFDEEALFSKINLGSGSSMAYMTSDGGETSLINGYCFFPLQVKPWWPTVPRLPYE